MGRDSKRGGEGRQGRERQGEREREREREREEEGGGESMREKGGRGGKGEARR